jgi:hypothetical protein
MTDRQAAVEIARCAHPGTTVVLTYEETVSNYTARGVFKVSLPEHGKEGSSDKCWSEAACFCLSPNLKNDRPKAKVLQLKR